MHVNDKRKLVWARVPKTGSTSVREALGPWHKTPHTHSGHHTHAMFSWMPYEFVEKYYEYEWAGCIRHPLAWLPSLRIWIRFNHPRMKTMCFGESGVVPDNWLDFLRELRVTPLDWLSDPRVPAVTIHKTEEMDKLAEHFGVPVRKLNVTREKRKDRFIEALDLQDDRVMSIIENKFHRELEIYKN